MPAKFVLRKGKTGQFSFALLSANGQTIVTSESYATKRAALSGIKSMQKNAVTEKVDDLTEQAAAASGKTVSRASRGTATGRAPARTAGRSAPKSGSKSAPRSAPTSAPKSAPKATARGTTRTATAAAVTGKAASARRTNSTKKTPARTAARTTTGG